MQPIRVSVVVLTYQQRDVVIDALEGVRSQTCPFDELIISDDASDDGTWERIQQWWANVQDWAAGLPTRPVVRRNERNLGLIGHFNRVAALASHELLVFCAGDDISEPQRVQRIVEDYRRAGCPRYYLAHSSASLLGAADGAIWIPPVVAQSLTVEEMAEAMALHIGATEAMSRALVADFPPLTQGVYEDLILGYRAALAGHYRYIDEPLVRYRPGGISFKERSQADLCSHRRRHLMARLKDALHLGHRTAVQRLLNVYSLWQSECAAQVVPEEAALPSLVRSALIQRLSGREWLREREPAARQGDDVRVAVYVRRWSGDEPDWRRTAQSLQQQSRPLNAVWTGRATWPTEHDLGQADWLWLLESGDELDPHAVECLQRAVAAAGGEALLLYSDHVQLDPECQAGDLILKPRPQQDLAWSLCYSGRSIAVRLDWAAARVGALTHADGLVLAYKLMLEALAEGLQRVQHVDAVLVRARAGSDHLFSTDSQAWQTMAHVLHEHAQQRGLALEVLAGPVPGTLWYRLPVDGEPLVSIIVPTRNRLDLIGRCVERLLACTDYPNYELIVIDHDSDEPQTRQFLEGLAQVNPGRIRVLPYHGPFNWSDMNNRAVEVARGDCVLFLNNDVYPLQSQWLRHMLGQLQRSGVGAVGAKLVTEDGRLQHAGVILGLRGPAEHPGLGESAATPGYMARYAVQQELMAVTGACMLVRKEAFVGVGGFDAGHLAVNFSDVDLCLKLREAGWSIVWTPLAVLVHDGGATQRALDHAAMQRAHKRARAERHYFYNRWPQWIGNDPFYHRGLSLQQTGYELETNAILARPRRASREGVRILTFPADYYGCGHYRILQPSQIIRDRLGADIEMSEEILFPSAVLRADATHLVMQRPVSDAALAALEELLALGKVGKIFEIDDLLDRLPYKSHHRAQMPPDIKKRLVKAMRRCDRLVVSSDHLADRYGQYAGDIRVMPNYINPALWGDTVVRRPHCRERPVIGWSGGVSHRGDLEMIADVIRAWADRVDWVFFGYCPTSLRPYVKEVHRGVPFGFYPAKLKELSVDWDLAIAPLENNEFNLCKTNLKLLEYGWCGLPVICSNLGPYADERAPVRRVRNKYEDWNSAIAELLNQPDDAERLGRQLQSWVRQQWTFDDRIARQWLDVWTLR
ncbi:MAG: glycosyltransferase [Tepidimonas sp.]|uniref:glycosyltransferase n=1 Tax=Tepidimonas sp. TaxID=2002775 RepID=UPI00298F3DE0|nr:glycosyltransferase [Tepidimonas sp.]MDW8336503.1 glycosyltransferase [Tepidimonas sp.]